MIGRLESTADHIAGTGSLWAYGRFNALKAVGAPTATATPRTVPATAAIPTAFPFAATAVPASDPPAATPRSVAAAPLATRVPAAAPRVPSPPAVARITTPPAGVSAVPASQGDVQILWQASVDSHTTFNVYRGDANGLDMRLLAAGIASAQKKFVDTTAPMGQTVTYSVAAQNAAGEGPHSPPVRNAASDR